MGMERSFIIKDHKISAFKDEVGKYLYSLFVALKRVSADYIRYTHHFTNLTDERSKSEISHVERVLLTNSTDNGATMSILNIIVTS